MGAFSFRVFVFLLIFINFQLFSEENNAETIKPTNKELYAVHRVGQIIDILKSESTDTVWPKFRLNVPAVLTFQNGHVLAFHLASSNPEWKRLSVDGQIALFSPSDHWEAHQTPLNQIFSIENQEAYLFAFDAFDKDPFLPFLVFVHERFHHHQMEFFGETQQVGDTRYEDHFNAENLTLIKLEELLLIDFLEAVKNHKDKKERLLLLKRFSAINRMRSRMLSPESLKWERLQQKMEGIADYVSIKLLDTHRIIPQFDGITHLKHLLQNYVQDQKIVESAIQGRHYGIGAVLGYALDDLEVSNWKLSVEQGKEQSILLNEKLHLSEQEIQQLAEEVKVQYKFQNLKDSIRTQLIKYEQEIAYFQKKYEQTEGIIVTLGKPQNKDLNGGGSVAHTFQLSNGRSLSLHCSSTAIITDASWKLSFNRIPLLFQNRAGEQEFKLNRQLILNIDGQLIPLSTIADQELEKSFRSLSWTGESSEFSSENLYGTISGKGGNVLINFY